MGAQQNVALERKRHSLSAIDKDPWCCASDKLRISVDGFDQGCLTTYRSVRYMVAHLPTEDALAVIDHLIADLEAKRQPQQKVP